MLGAIVGDVVGSVHEFRATKSKDFPLLTERSDFTDDTVLTVAVADWILDGAELVELFHDYARRYPHRSYGHRFRLWLHQGERAPYGSFGNGSAMRVSPVGFAFDTELEVLDRAERSAAVTHDHPEGIKGAQATALAILLARQGRSKSEIRAALEARFGYDLGRRLDDIRPHYAFDVTCQGSVPEAIIAFLESESYEDAIRNAISLGGDADTQACIAGGIAEAFHGGVPEPLATAVLERLDPALRDVVERFRARL